MMDGDQHRYLLSIGEGWHLTIPEELSVGLVSII
jgi:hypothetical protein